MMRPTRLGREQWRPSTRSARPFIGQALFPAALTVLVTKSGAPFSGVPVDVGYSDDSSESGVTGVDGRFVALYGAGQVGQAVIAVNGEAKLADLAGTPASVSFDIASVPLSPLVGLGAALAILGIITLA